MRFPLLFKEANNGSDITCFVLFFMNVFNLDVAPTLRILERSYSNFLYVVERFFKNMHFSHGLPILSFHIMVIVMAILR